MLYWSDVPLPAASGVSTVDQALRKADVGRLEPVEPVTGLIKRTKYSAWLRPAEQITRGKGHRLQAGFSYIHGLYVTHFVRRRLGSSNTDMNIIGSPTSPPSIAVPLYVKLLSGALPVHMARIWFIPWLINSSRQCGIGCYCGL
jgi:hypothetical protein